MFSVASRKTTGSSREYFIQGVHDNYCVRNHKRSKAKRTNYRTEVLSRSPIIVEIFILIRESDANAIGDLRKRIRGRPDSSVHLESSPDHSPLIPVNCYRPHRIRPWLKEISPEVILVPTIHRNILTIIRLRFESIAVQ